ncbi:MULTISPECIES: AEC family transporter [Halomicrobium]|uniref:Auxin Efflux Carrier n=2 Tax=Halomicrobium mukohataei TaxID=57705 RepID=C7NXV0_HALMD|nr:MULTISPECIES: AEC family transporter [Halomicrobium]ACV46538.1 Auxin Efflux Carrier [Halomicrobium mukohataei DSM 12286]QCD65081.1 AEC family transporter [Halomicrobium mukohataei]QFR19887.1 AEC family transporter [Halomicrobium sp. ZPS1]
MDSLWALAAGVDLDLLGRFAYMLALVAVGFGARRLGVLTNDRNERLGQVAFYVLLPALVFSSTYDKRLGELVSVALVAGLVVVIGTLVALSLVSNRGGDDDVRSVAVIQSYHGNFGYFGVPVVAATLGSTAAATASIILGLGALIQIPLTILVLVRINETEADFLGELRNLVTNPILLTLGVGLVFATLQLDVPTAAGTGLDWLSTLALPVALLAVGGSLDPRGPEIPLTRTATVVGLKVLVMPLIAWLVFSGLGADAMTRNAALVMFGAPTAVSTYVYATELGGDSAFASVNVFATTVASIVSLFFLLLVIT